MTPPQRLQPLFFTSVFLLSTLLLHLYPLPAAATNGTTDDAEFIRTSCNTTLYPDLCYSSLSGYASAVQKDPARLAKLAISVSLSNAHHLAVYFSNLSRQADYNSADHRAAAALHDCFSNFGDAVDEMRGSLKQMKQLGATSSSAGTSTTPTSSFMFMMSNVQTWMSAALTDEDTCSDGFEDVSDEELKKEVEDRVEEVKKFTSNALALVNSYAQKGTP